MPGPESQRMPGLWALAVKKNQSGISILACWIELPPVVLVSHKAFILTHATSLQTQLPANVPEKQQRPNTWVPATRWETSKQLCDPGFVLAQLQLLQPFGSEPEDSGAFSL